MFFTFWYVGYGEDSLDLSKAAYTGSNVSPFSFKRQWDQHQTSCAAVRSHVFWYREKQEFEHLEIQIDKLTGEKDTMESKIAQNAANGTAYAEVVRMSEGLASLAAEIENKTERWLELSDLADAQ